MMIIHRSLIYILSGIMLHLLLLGSAFSQLVEVVNENVFSSGRFYYNSADSVLYTNSIVVKFNQNVIEVPSGHRAAQIINVEQNYENVRGLLNDIESQFGEIIIIKQVKDASPGDLRRFNRRTGEEIYIHDFSQLFTLKFSNPVPLVSTISMFKNLDVVEYAHEPISIVLYETPNDEFYPDQWNLSAIEASSAWDITIGNANIVVGIVDEGTMQDHEDLVGKIIGGDEIEGEHGTWVSGVAGADTDNDGIGIASLEDGILVFVHMVSQMVIMMMLRMNIFHW
ncbi:MAG: hypothetical protein IIA61_07495 [Candidatus Marinimicrobia bacterium]|nr:hypothetical protein [Candidatus Neomarinimicrobiota bacterium]